METSASPRGLNALVSSILHTRHRALFVAAGFGCLLFALAYPYLFKNVLLEIAANNGDPVDREYYSAVFSYLHIGALLTGIGFFLLALPVFKPVKDAITGYRRVLMFVVIPAAIIQILCVVFIDTVPISDSLHYKNAAQRLLATGAYVDEAGSPSSFWPVGYPAFLAAIGFSGMDVVKGGMAANVVLYALLILTLYAVFARLFDASKAVVAAAVFAFLPNNLLSANILLTEFPFLVTLCLAILLLWRKGERPFYPLAIGIALGIASYLRPVGLGLPLVFGLYALLVWQRKAAMKFVAFMLAGFLLALVPWTIRNAAVHGAFVPVATNGGYNFLMGNHAHANGTVNFDFLYGKPGQSEMENERAAWRAAWRDVVADPLEALLRIPKKLAYTYARGDSSITWGLKVTRTPVPGPLLAFLFFAANASFYFVILGSLPGLFASLRQKERNIQSRFLFALGLYFIVSVAVFFGTERFAIPLLPVHVYLFSRFISGGEKKRLAG